jgi:hypothetical protein
MTPADIEGGRSVAAAGGPPSNAVPGCTQPHTGRLVLAPEWQSPAAVRIRRDNLPLAGWRNLIGLLGQFRQDHNNADQRMRRVARTRSDGCVLRDLTRRANQQNLVQPPLQKYSDFQKTQISLYPRPSCPTEGRLAIVTDAGQDAVDADAPLTNGA